MYGKTEDGTLWNEKPIESSNNHYNLGNHEPIKVIEEWVRGNPIFKQHPELVIHYGNCLKYLSRFDRKGSQKEDLEKARVYLNWLIDGMNKDYKIDQYVDITPMDIILMKGAIDKANCSLLPVKVGCIIGKEENDILNGFSGCNKDFSENTIQHAEAFALERLLAFKNACGHFHSPESLGSELTIYSTKSLCLECAKYVVEMDIRRVVMPEPYQINPSTGKASKWYETQLDAIKYMKEKRIKIVYFPIGMKDGIPFIPEQFLKDRSRE